MGIFGFFFFFGFFFVCLFVRFSAISYGKTPFVTSFLVSLLTKTTLKGKSLL